MESRGLTRAVVWDDEGPVEVIDTADSRCLYFGNRARQSSMLLHDSLALPLNYTRGMLAALLFCPQPQRILIIGLGGGSHIRFLAHHFPNCRIDCVEARASVVEVAKRYFHLPDTPLVRIEVGDGAAFIQRSEGRRYDLILIDAFDSRGVHHSVTRPAFFAGCRRLLVRGGVLSMNLWTTPAAGSRELLGKLASGFDGQLLRLPVERHANLVVIGLDKFHTHLELKSLSGRAKQLGSRLGLEMPRFLRALIATNTGLIRRLLDLRSA